MIMTLRSTLTSSFRDCIRVLVLGTGQMGAGIARLVLQKPGLELVGAYGRRAERAGMDLGQAIGLDHNLGIPISNELGPVVEQAKPCVAIQATCSHLTDAAPEIALLVRQRVPVISIAEEMAYPACVSPALVADLQQLAIAYQVAVLGTGINPGFVLDLLVLTLTGVCTDIRSITATRINDLSPYGPSVLRSQGIGLTPEAFRTGVQTGSVVGHVGFPQSISMIARALGWEIDRIEETREPIVSAIRRETPFVTVEPGQVAGCAHSAVAYRHGMPVITLIHPQQIHPQHAGIETGDSIEILGTPTIKISGSPEIPGGQGTVALAVNMIPHVLNAEPGLYNMADVPVPVAILGDARARLRAPLGEGHHG
ncbi:MAG: 2,4-diaminopentanoate dehydrogenase [Candidatus Binatia bacterium]